MCNVHCAMLLLPHIRGPQLTRGVQFCFVIHQGFAVTRGMCNVLIPTSGVLRSPEVCMIAFFSHQGPLDYQGVCNELIPTSGAPS
jgi:hypothetical protein